VPSERELIRRIRSTRNIQQVTKAMQTISASKMRRAQQAVLASRPYEEKLREILLSLSPYTDPEVHPLLQQREVRRAGIVLVTTDRGLVGAMNTNMIRAALRQAEQLRGAGYIVVGRKGIAAIRRLRQPLIAEFSRLGDRPSTADTGPIARAAVDEFLAGSVDAVYLAFTRFVTTLKQTPTLRRILPLVPHEEERRELPPLQYLFEPDPETVLEAVIPRLIAVAVYQAVLESIASEQSARMVAMRNATDTASELIETYTLAANKARQWRITKEMLEIASGSEALAKG
jgi:F-type H+-transporting ATPase subunit gamma